ncbi:MAG TPA: pyridoxamine 5'-phosphate oxidase family protein [Solirubrobacteraceae bacterium]|nr:pyridoxamine 5'-phosphate oxidase family protein [Solirubrobacteraceae bacterium]
MADKLEGRVREIFEDKLYAVVAVPRSDGTVQSVVSWVDTDGDNLTVNTAEAHGWARNMRRAGTATITVMAHPYEWVTVVGRVESDTHEGADEQIDALAKKYLGADSYPFRKPGEQRITFTLRPERITYVNHRADPVRDAVADGPAAG